MNEEEILDMLRKTGSLLTGHFLLTSGLHSSQYFQCAKVLQYPAMAEKLCAKIGRHFKERNVSVAAAPAVGGILVAHEVARFLGVRAIFTERENSHMALRRGFEIDKGERVLVVEDVITTGGSVREVLDLVKNSGAEPVGVACLVDRSGGQVHFGVELFSLVSLKIEALPPDKCNLCKQALPLTKPGSSKQLLDG
ncbi:MAG: orotate phosphoribosyltransferase [bacterium]